MSAIPSAFSLPQTSWAPRLSVVLEGTEIPATSVTVKLSAYGTADEISMETFFNGLREYLGFSIVQQSQLYAAANTPMQLQVFLRTSGTGGLSIPIIMGFLDIIHVDEKTDVCKLTGRGVFSILLDQKMTYKVKNNQPVEASIAEVVKRYGLNPIITAASGETVGKAMRDLQQHSARNLNAFQYVQSLANAVGWDLRAQGTSIIIGPPPDPSSALVIPKIWDTIQGGSELDFEHDAYHNHHIKVKVVSYLPRSKSKITAQSAAAIALGIPAPVAPSAGSYPGTSASPVQGSAATSLGMPSPAPSGGRGVSGVKLGSQSGYANVPRTPSTRDEMYVIHTSSKNQADCQAMANRLRDQISRHEITGTLTWEPDMAEAATFAKAGVLFNILLSGVIEEPVFNSHYWPKAVNWDWTIPEGLKLAVDVANHILPEDNQGTL